LDGSDEAWVAAMVGEARDTPLIRLRSVREAQQGLDDGTFESTVDLDAVVEALEPEL
jgi:hypothetical protein